MTIDLKALAAEFPKEAIHWRAQKLSKKGDKAMALAYLDARDVMDRLDAVCGPANWQSQYTETAKGRVLCSLGIRFGDEWVWKTDGAGNTAVEAEKGGISDALKRAAVSWGIGRYLYRIEAPWVPCKTFNNKWSDWSADPWRFVRPAKNFAAAVPTHDPDEASEAPAKPVKPAERDPRAVADYLIGMFTKADSFSAVDKVRSNAKAQEARDWLDEAHPPMAAEVKAAERAALQRVDPAGQAPNKDAA